MSQKGLELPPFPKHCRSVALVGDRQCHKLQLVARRGFPQLRRSMLAPDYAHTQDVLSYHRTPRACAVTSRSSLMQGKESDNMIAIMGRTFRGQPFVK